MKQTYDPVIGSANADGSSPHRSSRRSGRGGDRLVAEPPSRLVSHLRRRADLLIVRLPARRLRLDGSETGGRSEPAPLGVAR